MASEEGVTNQNLSIAIAEPMDVVLKTIEAQIVGYLTYVQIS
jgi:hypothetical protein